VKYSYYYRVVELVGNVLSLTNNVNLESRVKTSSMDFGFVSKLFKRQLVIAPAYL